MGLRAGIAALTCLPNIAFACLPGEGVFMSCTIEESGERLEVCSTADAVTYRFGPQGKKPDLELSVALADADYTPWQGVGRAIAEGIVFRNGAYSYEVYAGFDRMMEDEAEDLERHFGGVRVLRADAPLLEANCDPSTVDFAWSPVLWDQMNDAGLRWDFDARMWRKAP